MNGKSLSAVLASAIAVSGCGPVETQTETPGSEPTRAAATPVPVAEATAEQREGPPVAALPILTDEAQRGVKGARNVLLEFARAIENRRFDAAWALLSPRDRERWSQPAFAERFADVDTITVAVPDGAIEGAAGSSYYTAPITISGTRAGRAVRATGTALLRRVNDVDGATPGQLRWHFETLDLDAPR